MKTQTYIAILFLSILFSCSVDNFDLESIDETETEESLEVIEEETISIQGQNDFEFTCVSENSTDEILTNQCVDEWDCSFKVFPNSTVVLVEEDSEHEIIEGNNIVIRMYSFTEGAEYIADDEKYNTLFFELPVEESSFSFDGEEELAQLNIFYQATKGFTPWIQTFYPALEGCIQGELQDDNSWRVQCNLMFDDYIPNEYQEVIEYNHVMLDATFSE